MRKEYDFSKLKELKNLSSCLTGRNNPDHGIVFPVTVNYNKRSCS
jgi:hypothetical protein